MSAIVSFFLPCVLLSYFLLPYPGMFLFFVSLRVCSGHLLLSSKYKYVLCFCILPRLGIPFVLFV